MPLPESYREQDGCWNCRWVYGDHYSGGEPLFMCDLMQEKHAPPWEHSRRMPVVAGGGICDHHERKEGEGE